ncbi:MAG: carboxylating nicotinate-nucleotide diphosphorylase [Silvanigrellaceae bacterium]|nr:carboxylating nicotinate-nucleotide diphosphorylase [Silvanigrellaceae bacterium]
MEHPPKTVISPHCPYILPVNKVFSNDFVNFCNTKLGISPSQVIEDISSWLKEDAGAGDVTLLSTFTKNPTANFFIVAKQNFVLSGSQVMHQVFRETSGNSVSLFSNYQDGDKVNKGSVVFAGTGLAASILLAERVALNFGCHISGVATKTHNILQLIENYIEPAISPPTLLETRKTTPGLRIYEKYATRTGGARNHRHALDSGALLKENHLRAFGNVEEPLELLKKKAPILTKVEIEVTNLIEFKAAMQNGADVIMLDNFSIPDIRLAVSERNHKNPSVLLELSGNLDEKEMSEIVNCGVNFISMGALIHKAPWVDMSLQLYLR